MSGTHPERESFPWEIAVVDHPTRANTPLYGRSHALMTKLAATVTGPVYGPPPYEDHHGGGLWVLDATGWMCLQLPLGIEWSAQFCADPAKVDLLRQLAQRVLAAFPKTLPGYVENGYHDAEAILNTPITSADSVAAWTDSIFNASVALPKGAHTGVLPKAAGYHHYPKPIIDIDHFRRDDFQLFVTDSKGLPAVVVPVAALGSADRRVRLLAAHPQSEYAALLLASASTAHPRTARREDLAGAAASDSTEDAALLGEDDPLAQQAFSRTR